MQEAIAARRMARHPVTGFAVNYLAKGPWQRNGLRPFYEYRELGVAEASQGAFKAQHVRLVGPPGPGTGWHCHDLDFQLVYVLAGHVRFTVEGGQEVRLGAGDCAHLPPFFMHDETEWSPDFEVLEITAPAAVTTLRAAPSPQPDRGPSRFAVSHYREEDFKRGTGPRAFLEYRELGVTEATGRRVQAQIVRTNGPCDHSTGWHYHTLDFQFVYVLEGWARTDIDGHGSITLHKGDAMNVPARLRHDVTGFSGDFTVLEINAPADFDTVAA
ncbi:MAG: cupin domain-containing protein [Rhodospirillaceae bacterium]|nr:cupin domain-containing protein [Rhodospirillaceae bacterium]